MPVETVRLGLDTAAWASLGAPNGLHRGPEARGGLM